MKFVKCKGMSFIAQILIKMLYAGLVNYNAAGRLFEEIRHQLIASEELYEWNGLVLSVSQTSRSFCKILLPTL